jgi:hypothetical protein
MDPSSINPETINVGIFVVCAAFLANAIAAVATVIWVIIKIFRRNPPIDQTLKDYIAREEFQRHIEADREEFRKHAADNRDDFKRHDEEIKSMRTYNAKTTREIFDELRRMNAGFNKELQDLNKSVSRIEGEITRTKKGE